MSLLIASGQPIKNKQLTDVHINSASVEDFQSCRRKFILGHSWRLSRFRPKTLFGSLLRKGIVQLSNGHAIEQVSSEAKSTFLEKAANPGLDIIGKDPYQAAKGWISLLDSILHGLTHTILPVLHDPPSVKLTNSIYWDFLSWADDSGQLHRWCFVESWDADTISRELHSWRTFGDLVMSGCPLVLHAIVLGQSRNGRFLSPWTRTYVHPAMGNLRWRWTKPEDTAWKPVQLLDQHRLDVSEWIDQAWSQGAIQPLLQDQQVELPPESVCRDTKYQISREASDMMRLLEERRSYLAEPMSRGACDIFVPCHFQPICHTPDPVDLTQISLYVPRKATYDSNHVKTEVPAL